MVQGIVVAILVSVAWIVLQNVLMHWRPAENRFLAMVLGYLVSLPLVYVVYRWLPQLSDGIAAAMRAEAPSMGLFHAYLVHLLLFLFYGECFYHVERSVTLRLLVEVLKHSDQGVPLDAIRQHYPVEEMIQRRLEVMRDRGLVEQRGDSWHLRSMGTLLARVGGASSWLFQIKPQHERM